MLWAALLLPPPPDDAPSCNDDALRGLATWALQFTPRVAVHADAVVLLQPEAREAYARLLAQGWKDALRLKFGKERIYSFWDYRRNRWERDAGLRIDHVLLSQSLQLVDAGVDRAIRGAEEASDHAPVWVEFSAKAMKSSSRRSAATASTLPTVAFEPLARYNEKRHFAITSEPSGTLAKPQASHSDALSFVIQKHWASRLHYDFRLELDGVLISWAMPKGPSFDPKEKRMAMHVEDHPVDYASFEGTIPAKQYGAGTVIVWDNGTWEPVGDPKASLAAGKLVFHMHGQKLAGLWELVKIAKASEKQEPWMLFKKRDGWAQSSAEYDVISALPDSVVQSPLGLAEAREPNRSPRPTAPEENGSIDIASLDGAVPAKLPAKLAPQLATLAKGALTGSDWLFEIKLDGYRVMSRVEAGTPRLITRGGHDWTAKMQPLAKALATLDLDSAWLDGEVVVLGESGLPDFSALQNAFDVSRAATVTYFVFDIPFFGGYDLRAVPLHRRRALLKQIVAADASDLIRFSDDFPADATSVVQSACALKLEGIIAKRRDSTYASGTRSDTWLKLKCGERQEFVVVGFNNRTGGVGEVGALLLGYHADDGKLRYGGSVGTGWNAKVGAELFKRLERLEVNKPAVDAASVKPGRWSKRAADGERWVNPTLVAEISFTEWTADGHVRHPVFKGLRDDKPASVITREVAKVVGSSPASQAPVKTKVKVSNPDRVIDASTGLRKVDLVHFYETIADWILPHLKGRPVSLVRGPTGVGGELFFQKHDGKLSIPGMRELDADLWPGHASLLEVATADALINAAQMNVIEFHTWNSTKKAIGKPDRVIFDLDPGEGVTWAHIQEAAVLTRGMLNELGLQAWVKTSGGKGLHVVVPLTPRFSYEAVRAFSQAVVQHMSKVIPSRFVAKSGGTNRVGNIFIDYLRNGHAQTTAAAFSARARPGLGVSVPVPWEQLSSIKSGAQWSIATAREYLSFQKDDPWAGYWKCKQTPVQAIKMLQVVGHG